MRMTSNSRLMRTKNSKLKTRLIPINNKLLKPRAKNRLNKPRSFKNNSSSN